MDDGSPIVGLVLFAVCIMVNMVFYGFSSAVQSINESNLAKRCEEGFKRPIRVFRLIQKPAKYVNTIQTVVFIVDLLIGAVILRTYGNLFAGWLLKQVDGAGFYSLIFLISYIIIAFIILFIVLSLGVLVPKKIAARHAERWAYGLVDIISVFMLIFTPVTFVVNTLAGLILKIFRMDLNDRIEEVTEEEIMSMINEGHEQGNILASEAEMITNIFELGDKEASDVMTHRKNIVAVNGEWTLEETVKFILSENNSRFPVYIESIDNIIGILHLKDAVIFQENNKAKSAFIKDIPGLLRKVYFIPETRKLDILFKDMQSGKIHMEIVVDEYGQTAGLVAMEDILEEIVGNIFDEYDEEENNIILQEEGTYLVKGSTHLEELEEVLGIDLREEDFDTVNGFLISKLDRIPDTDELLDIYVDGYHYEILKVENNMISLVKITLPQADEQTGVEEIEELLELPKKGT